MTKNERKPDTDLDEDLLLARKELLRITPYSMVHIYRLERAGRFPARIKVGERRIAWRRVDVRSWLRSRPKAPAVRAGDDL